MTIEHIDLDNGLKFIHETRKYDFTLDHWSVYLRWQKTSGTRHGDELKDQIKIEVTIVSDQTRYRVTLYPTEDGGYEAKFWKKMTSNYAWRPSKGEVARLRLGALADKIWERLNSEAGKREMLTQTIAEAKREIVEVEARLNELREWLERMESEREHL
jgi:hypothetical protein